MYCMEQEIKVYPEYVIQADDTVAVKKSKTETVIDGIDYYPLNGKQLSGLKKKKSGQRVS